MGVGRSPTEALMRKLVDLLRKQGFRRGVVGSSRPWFAVWAAIGVARFLKARVAKEPEVVERFVMLPGQTVEIRDTGITRGALPKT
jgi:hypothetical protein